VQSLGVETTGVHHRRPHVQVTSRNRSHPGRNPHAWYDGVVHPGNGGQELPHPPVPRGAYSYAPPDHYVIMIVRDLITGPKRFEALQRAGINLRTLSARLRHLVREGFLTREPHRKRPPRVLYRLTDKGAALVPLTEFLRAYGETWLPLALGSAPRLRQSRLGDDDRSPVLAAARADAAALVERYQAELVYGVEDLRTYAHPLVELLQGRGRNVRVVNPL